MTTQQWGALWSLMNERFNQQKSPELAMFYLTAISARLTTVQIELAVQKILYANTFFPSPEEIVAAAGISSEAEALADWSHFESLMQGFPGAFARLSPTGQKMVQLMGGEAHLRQSPVSSLDFVRKEFLKLYPSANEIAQREAPHELGPVAPEAREIIAQAMPQLTKGEAR